MQAGWTADLFSRFPKPCAEGQLGHTGASDDPRLSHLRRYLGSLVRSPKPRGSPSPKGHSPNGQRAASEMNVSWDLGSSVEMAADKATNTAAFFQGPC